MTTLEFLQGRSRNPIYSGSHVERKCQISVIIPLTERFDSIKDVYHVYRAALETTDLAHEFVYVVDGGFQDNVAELEHLRKQGEPIRIVLLARGFGESAALNAGFRNSNGELIATLPAYLQIRPQEIARLILSLDHHDMLVARRWPRIDSRANAIQAWLFNSLVRLLLRCNLRDLGCGVRVFRREIAEEIGLYGDQHRFLPVIALRQGFSVIEVDAKQDPHDVPRRLYAPGLYARRVLDILSIYFLMNFTNKPLRFFGLVGSGTTMIGCLLLALLVVQRLFFGIALADRPMLLGASLLVVIGIQMVATGLVGELIIFVNRKSLETYRIATILDWEQNSEKRAHEPTHRPEVEPPADKTVPKRNATSGSHHRAQTGYQPLECE